MQGWINFDVTVKGIRGNNKKVTLNHCLKEMKLGLWEGMTVSHIEEKHS